MGLVVIVVAIIAVAVAVAVVVMVTIDFAAKWLPEPTSGLARTCEQVGAADDLLIRSNASQL